MPLLKETKIATNCIFRTSRCHRRRDEIEHSINRIIIKGVDYRLLSYLNLPPINYRHVNLSRTKFLAQTD